MPTFQHGPSPVFGHCYVISVIAQSKLVVENSESLLGHVTLILAHFLGTLFFSHFTSEGCGSAKCRALTSPSGRGFRLHPRPAKFT